MCFFLPSFTFARKEDTRTRLPNWPTSHLKRLRLAFCGPTLQLFTALEINTCVLFAFFDECVRQTGRWRQTKRQARAAMDTRRTGERQSLVSPARSAAREEGFLCTEPHLALACCPFRRLPGEAGSAIRVRLAASSLCSLPCKAPSGSSRPPQLVHLSVHPPRPLLRPPFRGLPALPAGRGTALGGRARIARAPSGPSACSEPTGRAARSVGGAHAVLGNRGRARSRPALRGIGGSFNSRCSGE